MCQLTEKPRKTVPSTTKTNTRLSILNNATRMIMNWCQSDVYRWTSQTEWYLRRKGKSTNEQSRQMAVYRKFKLDTFEAEAIARESVFFSLREQKSNFCLSVLHNSKNGSYNLKKSFGMMQLATITTVLVELVCSIIRAHSVGHERLLLAASRSAANQLISKSITVIRL